MDQSVKLFKAIESDATDEAYRILGEDSSGSIILKGLGPLRATLLQIAAWRGQTGLLDLLCRRGADVNDADKLGRCALHYAAQRGDVDAVKWLLRHGALLNSKFAPSFCTKEAGLKERALPRQALTLGTSLPLPDAWGRTALHVSVKKNNYEVTKVLIEGGADPNVKDDRGITPILLAGCNVSSRNLHELSEYAKIIQLLVSAKAEVNNTHIDTGTTALHKACILGSTASVKALISGGSNAFLQCISTGSTPLHEAAAGGHFQIIQLLLSVSPVLVNIEDKIGRTPLHRAAYQGHAECVILMIKHGGNLSAKTNAGISSIDVIFTYIKQPITLLEHVFDRSIRFIPSTEKDSYISTDFSILTPKKEVQMSVISSLINAATDIEQLSLLQHPLLELFLKLKWKQLRIFFIIFVLIHISFTISISTYSTFLLTKASHFYVSRNVLFFSSTFLMLHNLMQILMTPRYYVKQLEIWLSLSCSITSLSILSIGDDCVNDNCLAAEWKLHLISIVILLSWTHLMLLVGRIPMCGYYALMFYAVFKNLVKVLAAFIWLIIGFALSFSILFYKDNQFRNSWMALAKTIVMMMGEYEYANIFSLKESDTSFLLLTGRIVFLCFIILVSIVLMNLMIGLAVSDIQALEHVGHIQRLLKQAEFVAHLERITNHRIFRSNWINKKLRHLIEIKRKIPTKLNINLAQNLPFGNLDISTELTESIIEIARRNKEDFDETDGDFQGSSRINFKQAISNIKKQLQVIEQLKFRGRYCYLKKRKSNLNFRAKCNFNAISIAKNDVINNSENTIV